MMPKIVDRGKLPDSITSRISPVDAEIAKLGETYYKVTEVARLVGVSTSTIRRLIQRKTLPIPSKVLFMGEGHTYLFTEGDVELIRKHYHDKNFGSN